jgi:hypothetical protein
MTPKLPPDYLFSVPLIMEFTHGSIAWGIQRASKC